MLFNESLKTKIAPLKKLNYTKNNLYLNCAKTTIQFQYPD